MAVTIGAPCSCILRPTAISTPSTIKTAPLHIYSSATAIQRQGRSSLVPLISLCISSIAFWQLPAQAGILSGATGLDGLNLPQLPQSEYLREQQEETRKKYENFDAQFKSSPLLQELLKRSKENAQLHKNEVQTKYCERGAEWGVGDCSLVGATKDEKEAFLKALRSGIKALQ